MRYDKHKAAASRRHAATHQSTSGNQSKSNTGHGSSIKLMDASQFPQLPSSASHPRPYPSTIGQSSSAANTEEEEEEVQSDASNISSSAQDGSSSLPSASASRSTLESEALDLVYAAERESQRAPWSRRKLVNNASRYDEPDLTLPENQPDEDELAAQAASSAEINAFITSQLSRPTSSTSHTLSESKDAESDSDIEAGLSSLSLSRAARANAHLSSAHKGKSKLLPESGVDMQELEEEIKRAEAVRALKSRFVTGTFTSSPKSRRAAQRAALTSGIATSRSNTQDIDDMLAEISSAPLSDSTPAVAPNEVPKKLSIENLGRMRGDEDVLAALMQSADDQSLGEQGGGGGGRRPRGGDSSDFLDMLLQQESSGTNRSHRS